MCPGILHPIGVWKRLCVSVFFGGGICRFVFQDFESILDLFGYFVKQNVKLNIGFGFVVLNSIW